MSDRRTIALLAAVLLLPAMAAAQSSVYRWVDKDGKVHYSDSPPETEVKNVTQKRMGGGGAQAPQLPFATQQAMKNSPAVLYVSATCGEFCSRGRARLAARGIPYSERDVGNAADGEQVKKLIGSLAVPVLTLGEKALKGFREDAWQAALDAAGYPRTALPGQRNPLAPPPVAAAKSEPPPPAPLESEADKAPAK